MFKVECPRCMNGKGNISAFKHVQGGVCFKCGGNGYINRKTKPVQAVKFSVMQKWTDPNDCNYNNGDFISTFVISARTEKEANKKMESKLSGCGREYYCKPL